ncbi:DEAD/DEAH box helicase family protein [Plantactinospora veratri]
MTPGPMSPPADASVGPQATGTAPLPVLWLYGPPAVGKSTVAWELFTRLSRQIPTAYVDLDQLGMCYGAPTPDNWAPEPASDPGRHRRQTRNLNLLAANVRSAGARCLVASGVVDAVRGIDVDLLPEAALTARRLRGEPSELRQRLAGRARAGDEAVDGVLAYAAALDRNHPTDLCVDTTGRSVTEVAKLVLAGTGGWPALTGPRTATTGPYPSYPAGPGEILWLCGATAVGKSTVGWQVYTTLRSAGRHAAFVDLGQLGFYRPAGPPTPRNHRLRAGNLAAVWQTFRATGLRRLVVVGPADDAEAVRTYREALPSVRITLCRLHAGRDSIAERVVLRGRGQGPLIAGDDLRGSRRPGCARSPPTRPPRPKPWRTRHSGRCGSTRTAGRCPTSPGRSSGSSAGWTEPTASGRPWHRRAAIADPGCRPPSATGEPPGSAGSPSRRECCRTGRRRTR